jgi:lipopolysaccharide/colanic/teichoic acid biosynthesis glycosyltransferase
VSDGPTRRQAAVKRAFDVAFAAVGLVLTSPLILLAWLAARLDTGLGGFFRQRRIGLHGRPFDILKIRTMKPVPGWDTVVTTERDPRITRLGRFLRRSKLDELPQFYNILVGDMSFVGPRPEVPAYIQLLADEDRVILSVRPGLTGPATLKYRDEQRLLAGVADPERYNREVIFPDKVRLNREYIEHYSLRRDFAYLWRTVAPGSRESDERRDR